MTEGTMMEGTVSEFDAKDGVGIIDADDGKIVFFNTDNLPDDEAPLLTVGLRVRFESHEGKLGPHADFVRLSEQ